MSEQNPPIPPSPKGGNEVLREVTQEEIERITAAMLHIKTLGKGWGNISINFKNGRIENMDVLAKLKS